MMDWAKSLPSPMFLLCGATLGLAFSALGFCQVPFAPSPVGGRIAMSLSTFGTVLAGMGVLAATVDLIVLRKWLPVGLWWIALMANAGSFVVKYVVGDFQNVHVLDYLDTTYPLGLFMWPLIFGLLFAAPLATMVLFALAFVRFIQWLSWKAAVQGACCGGGSK